MKKPTRRNGMTWWQVFKTLPPHAGTNKPLGKWKGRCPKGHGHCEELDCKPSRHNTKRQSIRDQED